MNGGGGQSQYSGAQYSGGGGYGQNNNGYQQPYVSNYQQPDARSQFNQQGMPQSQQGNAGQQTSYGSSPFSYIANYLSSSPGYGALNNALQYSEQQQSQPQSTPQATPSATPAIPTAQPIQQDNTAVNQDQINQLAGANTAAPTPAGAQAILAPPPQTASSTASPMTLQQTLQSKFGANMSGLNNNNYNDYLNIYKQYGQTAPTNGY